ncbi:MAG: phospho-sugar mutase, partial [Bacteroidales bacterium]
LKKFYKKQPIAVAVSFDSRKNSRYFAQITADVLSANEVTCYLFEDLRPTPELSFAVRFLKCQAGVMITASHNPKEYNGYKVYWSDGGQLVAPHDSNVVNEVNSIKSIENIKWERNDEKVKMIGEEIDSAYLALIRGLSWNPQAIKLKRNFKIVYTPLHGTGITVIPRALEMFGFKKVILVESQAKADGNFPTVKSPNPEEKSALELALKKAEEVKADLVMATDPDADRVGIAVRNNKGEMELLNGNMTGCLLFYYLLSEWQKQRKIDGCQFTVKTIVTTDLISEISTDFNVPCEDVLTGFKYIAEKIESYEGEKTFIVGGEESYGYLVGNFVRDKDAVSACCMIAEMAAYYATQRKSLYDVLLDIYKLLRCYKEELVSITKKGKKGAEEIKQMMIKYRNNPPEKINGQKVTMMKDYLYRKEYNYGNHTNTVINLPKSDVLQFFTADGSKITIRPSGTEPKIKFYFSVVEELKKKTEYEKVNDRLNNKIQAIIQSMNLIE